MSEIDSSGIQWIKSKCMEMCGLFCLPYGTRDMKHIPEDTHSGLDRRPVLLSLCCLL